MYRLLAILALLGAIFAQDNSKELNVAIDSIFGPQNSTTAGGTGLTSGGTKQSTNGTSQNINGTSHNTSDTSHNTSDTSQNTDVIESVLGPTNSVPPPSLQENDEDVESLIDSVFRPTNNTADSVGTSHNTEASNVTSCKIENGEAGECVRYYLCNSTIVDDLIDIHNPLDEPCPSYLDVCCTPDKKVVTHPVTSMPTREGCGYSNSIGSDASGAADGEAKFGEFPWVVAILKSDPVNETKLGGQKQNEYVGSGSLIHPSVVLTAAHSVAAAAQLRVRAGEWDSQATTEPYPHQERDVARIVIHKDFNNGNLFYDIAVLFLSSPMDLAPNVGVVCLPQPRDRVQGGTRCFSSGWGKDRFSKEGLDKVILNKVEVPVVERQSCQESLRRTRLGHRFMLHSSFMCIEKDSCKADGGAPLVCPIEFEEKRYMQSGIAAWGVGCGQAGTPEVYVDVANLRDWIDDKVKGQGYLINGYSYTV